MTDPIARICALPGVAESVARARDAVDRLLSHRVLRRRSAEVTAEAALRSARASAALEGAGIELERLRGQLLGGGAVELPSKDAVGAVVVQSAVRLQAELGSVLGVWRRSPPQALARLHVLAASDLVASAEALGRPRSGPDQSTDLLGLGTAPVPMEVAARLDGLGRVLLATTAPAVVVGAVVHGELLALRPFGCADGLVARAAGQLALVARGLDPKAVSSPAVGHEELHHEYAARARGYVAGGSQGVADWVIHCADAVGLGAREGLAVCEAILRNP